MAGSWDRRQVRWGLECEIGGCMASLLRRWLCGLGGCALDADVVGLVDVEVIVVFVVGGAGATVLARSGGSVALDTDFVQIVGGDGGVVINRILVVVGGCG